jgi:hypothetical protein
MTSKSKSMWINGSIRYHERRNYPALYPGKELLKIVRSTISNKHGIDIEKMTYVVH